MYFIAKLAQASGLAVIAVAFVFNYPKLMNPRIFTAGLVIFVFGWIVQQFLLRR